MGTIPIISDIIDALKWSIDFLFNKLPKPLLMLLFLVMLFVSALLMNLALQIMGIHCTSQNEVVKTNTLDFFGNINVYQSSASILKDPSYTFQQLFPNKNPSTVIFYGKLNTSVGFYVDCGENDTGCSYYLKAGQCYNCSSYKEICVAKTFFFCGEYITVCLTDAYYFANPSAGGICNYAYAKIPYHYAFNKTTGTYTCVDPQYCGASPTKIATSQLDDQLAGMDAEVFYKNNVVFHSTSNRDITRMAGITCNNYQPTLAFFGIAVLDYRIWVLLIALWIMFMFLVNMGQQSHL